MDKAAVCTCFFGWKQPRKNRSCHGRTVTGCPKCSPLVTVSPRIKARIVSTLGFLIIAHTETTPLRPNPLRSLAVRGTLWKKSLCGCRAWKIGESNHRGGPGLRLFRRAARLKERHPNVLARTVYPSAHTAITDTACSSRSNHRHKSVKTVLLDDNLWNKLNDYNR